MKARNRPVGSAVRLAVLVAASVAGVHAHGGNCLVQNGKKIGDCDNVHVGPGRPLDVKQSGTFSGNYARTIIRPGVTAYISGNTDNIVVMPRATLHLSGNSDDIRVEGTAHLSGNMDWVYVARGGLAIIHGIADGVSGPGRVVKAKGSIIGGVYMTREQVLNDEPKAKAEREQP